MKKSKNIINANCLAQIIVLVAILFATIAASLLITKHGRETLGLQECTSQITVSNGDTLTKLLTEQGFSLQDIDTISKILKSEAGVSGLRANSDKIIFSRRADDAPVTKIVLIPGPWQQIELTCNEGQWIVKKIDIEKDERLIYKNGEIKDGDSFYIAGMRAGIPEGILIDVYDLLAFEMDFERDIRAGQNFSVLYEENYASGEKVANGRVVAISFQALRGEVKMYRFRKPDGSIGYYDEDGNGAIKSLKRTPINNARVSSSFSMHRLHPVLGFTRKHLGVDFRAGTGTPIPSAGGGRVVARGYNNGHGNFIRIRHNGSYETLYGHMSRFAKGVGVGTSVRQGQIIGYVGSTGLATGPHLHYEVIKNGMHVNPMTVKLPAIDNLSPSNKAKFIEIRKLIDSAITVLLKKPDLFVQL
ncbi:MAG: peptidoglycan DD-metalloendopeptidase family protein [Alphaproteobacteria bacterium]|nr:peptidoglycan DD-metalloendopeptidase family protein [Alphaproteobacteria bacterium]MBN2674896.1 peptidoglycan DD-metalloendopeptidase family protein [Alphaproteobacteria bacterium]